MMNDRMSDRTRGYVGVTIPTDQLTEVVRQVLGAQFGVASTELERIKAEETVLLSRTGEYGGTEYRTLVDEGVQGERVAHSNTVEVFCLDGFQQIAVPVGAPLLVELAKRGEVVDLADFVRVFGDRLETNLHLAQSWIREFVDPLTEAARIAEM